MLAAVPWLLILAYMLSAYLPPDIRTSRVEMDGDRLGMADGPSYRGDQTAIIHDIASAWLALASTVLIAEARIQRRYGIVRAGRRRARGSA